ncbi:MAG: sporulation protein [Oscillospiraceae bacterium]|nr:sporulation protein [Oscillospiraceae bacterium]
MVRQWRSFLIFLPTAAVMALLLLRSAQAAEAVRSGLRLCAASLLPALFPFFVAVSFAVNAGLFHTLRHGRIPTAAAVFFLGALGGYPLGGRTAGEAYRAGLLTKKEAESLLMCCNNAGPAFILTVVGQNVFQSASSGLVLWGIHLATALALFFLFHRRKCEAAVQDVPQRSLVGAFLSAVTGAAETMLRLSAFVVFFSVAMALLATVFGPVPPLLAGVLELTVGVTNLANDRLGFTAAAALLGWGGVAVHAQTAAVLSDTDLSLRPYLAGKALQGLLSAALAWCAYPFI